MYKLTKPEQLPEAISVIERLINSVAPQSTSAKQSGKPLFFSIPTDQQITIAQRQIAQISQLFNTLYALQDQYFIATLQKIPVALDDGKPVFYDEMHVTKGQLEANIILLERMIKGKELSEANSTRFLTNQLTAHKKAHQTVQTTLDEFVDRHAKAAQNNVNRLDGLSQKLQAIKLSMPAQAHQEREKKPLQSMLAL